MNQKLVSKLLPGGYLQNTATGAYGTYRGFRVCINTFQNGLSASIGCNASSEAMLRINEDLRVFTTSRKLHGKFVFQAKTIQYEMPQMITQNKGAEEINEVVSQIVTFLEREQLVSGCSICGKPETSFFNLNGSLTSICDECQDVMKRSLDNNKEVKQGVNSNVVLGLVGAIIGSLAGAVVWVLIYKAGYIASLAGLIMVFGALKLYSVFGKGLDIKGIIVSCVVVMAMVYVSNRIGWAWEITDAVGTSFWDTFKEVHLLIELFDAKAAYVRDLVLGYLFAIGGGIAVVLNAVKEAKGSYKFEKL